MDPQTQLKSISPYLDTHLLLHLLQRNVAKESVGLQTELKARLAITSKEHSDKSLDEAKDKATKLVTLLNNAPLCE